MANNLAMVDAATDPKNDKIFEVKNSIVEPKNDKVVNVKSVASKTKGDKAVVCFERWTDAAIGVGEVCG